MFGSKYTRLIKPCQQKFTRMRESPIRPGQNPVVRRILEVSGMTSVRQMCLGYRFSADTLRRAVASGESLPELWLDRVALRTGCRVEYLRTGALPKFDLDDPETREVMRLFRSDLNAQGRTLVVRLARVAMRVLPEAELAVRMVERAAEEGLHPPPGHA